MTPASDRVAGVLLHPSSLPGRGIGELGEEAFRFVDWLVGAGQSLWQILPLVPTSDDGSPYSGLSAVGGNPNLVSLERLQEDGLLTDVDLAPHPVGAEPVDYAALARWKPALLGVAWRAFRDGAAAHLRAPFEQFRQAERAWVEELALFLALREHFGHRPWREWDDEVRLREPAALVRWRARLAEDVERQAFVQFLFARQWQALRAYANARGVRIVGDVPIFVAHDSVDVWAHPELFHLDDEGRPTVVAGVPPDYFSATGQRWGNPLYRWDVLAARGYDWWVQRFRRTFAQVDVVRIDHFRGFDAYWEIPAGEETAVNGEWVPGPGAALFRALEQELGELPLIAEDLGLITPSVEALRDELGLPGMRVLQFAFGDDGQNPHLPANYPEHTVAYPGTHDNDTLLGWWAQAELAQREQAKRLLPPKTGPLHWALIRLVWESRASWAIVLVQDVLGLGNAARLNTPGQCRGNWRWRLQPEQLTPVVQQTLRDLTRAARRDASRPEKS